MHDDGRWLAAAASVAARARPLSRPNPAVGAVVVKDGRVLARGWTGAGGRPHAEHCALAEAGEVAKGATLFVTLEPCAHQSQRGPACADVIANSELARVVIGCLDPDPRTGGKGIERIRQAGIAAELVHSPEAHASLAGYLIQRGQGRPHVTLKLALSQDGCLARPAGQDRWLTGEPARAHCHALRAKSDAILVGSGTLRIDEARLDVRLPGLELRSPARWVLTGGKAPEGWSALPSPKAIKQMADVQYLFIEGGAQTAQAFLTAGLVDRLVIYRAPFVIGTGVPTLPELAAGAVAAPWQLVDTRPLGSDTLEVYEHYPCLPE